MATVTYANIHVENGQESGDSSRMAVHVLPKRGGRAGETLVMFLDAPNAPANVCAAVLKMLRDGYANAPGGVTSALRLAIKLANDSLMEFNRGATRPIEGSITCAVVGDASVVLAQCGPALTYVRTTEGVFERIEPQGVAAGQLVGRSSTVDVYFDNVAHQAGTIYVLSGARSYPQPNDRLVAACMSKGDAETVAAYLNVNVKQTMAGVVFEVSLQDAAAASEEEEESVPMPTASSPSSSSATGKGAAAGARRHAPAPEPEPEPVAASRPTSSAGAPRRPLISPELRDRLGRMLFGLRDGLMRLGGRLHPDPQAALPPSPARVSSTRFLTVAAMVLLPIVVISIAVPFYLEFSGEAERRETKQRIEAQLAEAQAARDPADVRTKWTALQAEVEAYGAKYPEYAADFSEVRTQARAQIDALVKIVRVNASRIVGLQVAGRHRVAASAMGVYELSVDDGVASYTPLNDDHTAVAAQAQPVLLPFTDEQQASRALVDIAWATNNDSRWRTEGAVMFGTDGVYEYSSATTRAAPRRISAGDEGRPSRVVAGEIYNSTIYLLDAEVGQIWKYSVDGEQLKSAQPYFRAAFEPLKGAVDLGIDGAVYVLLQNGSVQKFFNRSPQPFAITGLPEPIGSPVAMVVTGGDPERGNVYVLDAKAGSVLEFDKKGVYLRQYRGNGDEFAGATDLAVDMARRTGYVVTENNLFTFKLQAGP